MPLSQILTVPAPYCPFGISPSKLAYSYGWSSVSTARRRSSGFRDTFRDCPAFQYPAAFQPQVPVEPSRMVLLDYKNQWFRVFFSTFRFGCFLKRRLDAYSDSLSVNAVRPFFHWQGQVPFFVLNIWSMVHSAAGLSSLNRLKRAILSRMSRVNYLVSYFADEFWLQPSYLIAAFSLKGAVSVFIFSNLSIKTPSIAE